MAGLPLTLILGRFVIDDMKTLIDDVPSQALDLSVGLRVLDQPQIQLRPRIGSCPVPVSRAA
jgi:hypothetical protein